MYAKLLGFLLLACQIILNESHVIRETTDNVINVESKLAPESSTLPEGYVRFPDVHAAYKVYTGRVTWLRARDLCIADGAHLAITDTVQKIQYIRGMHPDNEDWISVGIRKSRTTDEWVRDDNDLPVANIPWKENNPDYAGDCTGISLVRDAIINYSCNYRGRWYVCEIPI